MSELKPCPNMLCGSINVKPSVLTYSAKSVVCNECWITAPHDDWQAPRPAENKIKAQGAAEFMDKYVAGVFHPSELPTITLMKINAGLEEYANKLEGES